MFEIHVTDTDVSGGSIAVTWCLDKDSLVTLSHYDKKNPYVVLCTAAEGDNRPEFRKIAPLKDLLAYIEFRSAGKCNIFAFVVKDKDTAQRFLLKRLGGYSNSICTWDATSYPYEYRGLDIFAGELDFEFKKSPEMFMVAEHLSVDVPKESFAAEPSQWEKNWVNFLFRNKCVDQCDFRRRRLFAYTIQVVLMILNLTVRLGATLLALFLGTRNFSLKYLLHPMTYELSDPSVIFGGGTYFIGRGSSKILNYARLLLAPPFLALLLILGLTHVLWTALVWTAVILVGGAILATIGYYLVEYAVARELNAKAWYLSEEEQALIVCGLNKPKKLGDLPSRHRTLKLRFQDLKSKVCRPFSA